MSSSQAVRILLLEDSPTDARLLQHDLGSVSGQAFTVTWVDHLKQALSALHDDSFDIALLDLNLPDSSGITTYTTVQKSAPDLPIVVLTGAIDDAAGAEAIRSGVQDYLVKGMVSGNDLVRSIRYAIERKNSEQLIRKSAERFELLSQNANELLQSSDPQKLVESLCQRVMHLLDCQACFNFIINPDVNKLHLNACIGIPEEEKKKLEWLDLGVAVCGCVAQEGCRIVAEHISTTPDPRTDLVKSYGIKAYACHPLLGEGGKTIGTLSFGTKNRDTFSPDDLSLMKAITDQVAMAMVRKTNENELRSSRMAALNLMDDAIESRKQADIVAKKLAENRADLDRAQSVAHIGNWRFNLQKNEFSGSEETYRIFGLPNGQKLSYESTLGMIHADDREFVDLNWKAFLAGESFDLEHRIFVDGNIKWVREKAELEIDAKKTILGAFGTLQDITDRKKREQELYKLNRALAALNATDQALTHASDEKEYIKEICRIVQEDCGHAMVWIGFADDNEEKSVTPIAFAGFEEGYLDTLKISWADTERGQGPTGTAIRTGKISECKNMHTDPAFAPWREHAIKRGYASSLVIPLFTMTRDRAFGAITLYDKKPDGFPASEVALLSELANDLALGIQTFRLRNAHAKAEIAIRESEARYRSLFNSMTEGFALHEIICNEEGKPVDYRFLDVNPAFEKLTGLLRKDIVGKTSAIVPQFLDDGPRQIARYGRVALTGKPVHFENYSSARKAHFDIFSYQPAPMQFATIIMNISEQVENRKKIEELNIFLKRRAAELSTSYNELQTLTQLLSYDLRVPLRVVSGYSHLLLKEYADKIDASGNKYIHFLDSGVQRINQLLDNMLILSGISRKQMWLQRINLSSLCREVVEEFKRSAPDRKVEFIIRENVLELADQGFMKQVLHNLFENSLKFTASQVRPVIEFGIIDGQEPQVCFVRDNGCGFDQADHEKLFSPFQKRSIDSDFVSTGIGLAIVERIIQRHGGKVWAEGEKDKGATFYFKLG